MNGALASLSSVENNIPLDSGFIFCDQFISDQNKVLHVLSKHEVRHGI